MQSDEYTQCLSEYPAEYVDQLPRHPAWRFLRLPFAPIAPVAPMGPGYPAGPAGPKKEYINNCHSTTASAVAEGPRDAVCQVKFY